MHSIFSFSIITPINQKSAQPKSRTEKYIALICCNTNSTYYQKYAKQSMCFYQNKNAHTRLSSFS